MSDPAHPDPNPPDRDLGAWRLERRDFLKLGAGALVGLALGCRHVNLIAHAPREPLRFGLVTDPHYADADPHNMRYYRESLDKMREAIDRIRGRRATFLAELGDIKDMVKGEPDTQTLEYLKRIEAEVQRFGGPVYHVLGNHDMDNLSKAQAMAHLTNTDIPAYQTYYAFRHGGIRFIVLDACYRADGVDYDHGDFDHREAYIPEHELVWLRHELNTSREPVIILAHQRLDGSGDVFVKNAAQIRAALEPSGKVLAVFTGHDHAGGYSFIHNIHYYTQRAMVEFSGAESNSYTIVEVSPSMDITVSAYRRAISMKLDHGHRTMLNYNFPKEATKMNARDDL